MRSTSLVHSTITATVCAAALSLGVVAPTGVASAQESVTYKGKKWTVLPEARWGKLGTRDFGKLYCVSGRWLQVQGNGVLLFKGPINTKRFLRIRPGPLKENLTAGLSARGDKLVRKRSMVRVFGKANRGSQGTYLGIESVQKLEDEAITFKNALEKAGDDVAKVAALAKKCAARAKLLGDAELAAMARKISRRELQVRAKGLSPDDHAARFELAKRFRTLAGDAPSAIQLYSMVVEAPKASAKLRAKAKDALLTLRAVRIRKTSDSWVWVTYSEFKRSEGFLPRKQDGRTVFVRREYAELLEVVATETRRQASSLDPPRQNDFQSGQDARTGKILRGQTYAEVRTAARAFPASVYHKVLPWGASGRALWTQWIMPKGGRVYFLAVETDDGGTSYFPPGEVVGRRPTGTPWPEK
ncbi:MAG: hypothetical protein JKY65_07045 [Planctomycetes bacterium]|nr:hypothetical protein [Planctomycetota bacterium]